MDLTKSSPFSARGTTYGVVTLAHPADKTQAFANGSFGEYRYDYPMGRERL